MSARRAFERLTLLTALTSIAAYCVAESNAPMAMVALPAALGAWWLRGRAFAADVPRIALNLILMAVLAYAVLSLIDSPAITVDDVARLILILLVVKLFDRQSARDSAQVLSLSLFLAIGAILTSVRFELGLLLVPLIPMLIVATMQYQMHAGFEAAERARLAARPAGVPAPPARFIAGRGWNRQLRGVALVSGLGIGATAVAVFVLVPRGENSGFLSRLGAPSAALQTRFTSTVQLGRGGFLSESQRVVMQASITDTDGLPMGGPEIVHYLRGNVLDAYDPERFSWHRSEEATRQDRSEEYEPGQPMRFGDADGPRIMQHITLLDSSQAQRFIFMLQRPIELSMDTRTVRPFSWNKSDRRVLVPNQDGELRYTAVSVDPTRRTLADGRPPERPALPASFGSEPIAALAAQVLTRAGLDPAWANRDTATDSRACRAIQSFLRQEYAYTTEIQAAPPGRDPIEWFLLDHKRGHCEYFASAMAAMCRSVGIPARVIAGYVAAEWNPASSSYVVRESNAHAWVEAQITSLDWRTFDATPPGDLYRLHRPEGGVLTRLRHLLDAMEQAWMTSVVTYDQGARERLFREGARGAEDWITRLPDTLERVRLGGVGLVVRAVLAGGAAFAVVAAGGWIVQAMVARRARRSERRRAEAGDVASAAWRVQTGFYPALLAALDRRDLSKPAWAPPLDHAASVRSADPEAAGVLERLAGLYYQARFGIRRLSDAELASAEAEVRALRSRTDGPEAR
jgi:hypothetical protein